MRAHDTAMGLRTKTQTNTPVLKHQCTPPETRKHVSNKLLAVKSEKQSFTATAKIWISQICVLVFSAGPIVSILAVPSYQSFITVIRSRLHEIARTTYMFNNGVENYGFFHSSD